MIIIFAELKEAELLTNRLSLVTSMEAYIGKYFSTEYVRKKILRQSDSEIIEIDAQIDDEIEKGILPDPNAQVDEMGNPIPEGGEAPPAEGVPEEVPQEAVAPEPPPEPKGGKI
jgi:Bacteriophage T4-like capsid assembly protein (Gp20).